MSEDMRFHHAGGRDPEGFFLDMGGHQWKDDRGPGSACERCGLSYAQWSGDRCDAAPDCMAEFASGVRCDREEGHPYKHVATVEWSAVQEEA